MELSEIDLVEIRTALEKETLTEAIEEMERVMQVLCRREGYHKSVLKERE